MGMNDDKRTSVDGRLWMDVSGRKGPDKQNWMEVGRT